MKRLTTTVAAAALFALGLTGVASAKTGAANVWYSHSAAHPALHLAHVHHMLKL
jgi:hypothetical protein